MTPSPAKSGPEPPARWCGVEVDLDTVAANVTRLVATAAPARVWAVVKADAYGHGAPAVARAALAGGADGLCVALVAEGARLRTAGITAPVLVLSEQPEDSAGTIVELDLSPTVYSERSIRALAAAASARGRTVGVHLKVDTGMRRVGAEPGDAPGLARLVADLEGVRLAGLSTHLAVADDPAHPATARQLAVFDSVVAAIEPGPDVLVHVANSAGAIAHPSTRRDLVRPGIAVYGIDPSPSVRVPVGVCPALRWWSRVSWVKTVEPGEHVSYGWRHRVAARTRLATVPLGYADGVPRRYSAVGGEVLVNGRRRRIVGVVTMDQLIVDLGPDSPDDPVDVGDEVVLIGRQGDESIRVEEWAERLDTIGYEIVCSISGRVPRTSVGAVVERS
ncbi:MAG: alanine racemase [Actinomycetota bacterium]|jgi:alanine racemase